MRDPRFLQLFPTRDGYIALWDYPFSEEDYTAFQHCRYRPPTLRKDW